MHTACAVQQASPARDWSGWIGALRRAPLFWWLDSAQVCDRLGRYCYAGADPYLVLRGFGDRTELEVRRAARPELEPGRWHRGGLAPRRGVAPDRGQGAGSADGHRQRSGVTP